MYSGAESTNSLTIVPSQLTDYEFIQSEYNEVINRYVPTRMISTRYRQPWYNNTNKQSEKQAGASNDEDLDRYKKLQVISKKLQIHVCD